MDFAEQLSVVLNQYHKNDELSHVAFVFMVRELAEYELERIKKEEA